MGSVPEALFHRSGPSTFTPTLLTTGPWRADAMHGGPPTALVATGIVEACAKGFHLARVNVELERPVPLEPLTVSTSVRVVSRRVHHIDAELTVPDGTVVASARGLALARSDVAPPRTPQHVIPDDGTLDTATAVRMTAFASGDLELTYHRDAVEHRLLPGSAFTQPGPASSWVRLRYPLVADEPVLPWARVMAAADFGSGISARYAATEGVGLINADLSVAVHREPIGEWIRIDARTDIGPDGTAHATSRIHDETGELGVGSQSLLGITF